MRRIAEEHRAFTDELGGSISGEHGDGLSRSEFLKVRPELVRAFGEVKRARDPYAVPNTCASNHLRWMTSSASGRAASACPWLPTWTSRTRARRRGAATAWLLLQEEHGHHVPLVHGHWTSRISDQQANMLRSVLEGTLPPRS